MMTMMIAESLFSPKYIWYVHVKQ